MPSVLFQPYVPNAPSPSPERNGLNGFDDTDGRPWQMVPAGGERCVKVVVIGPGRESWRVEPADRRLRSVAPADPAGTDPRLRNVYRIVGGDAAGPTGVVVRNSRGTQWGRLDVDIKPLRTPGVKFFLVSDRTGRATSTTAQHAKEWVDYANRNVFEPQVNVRFKLESVTPITIDDDLGDPIDFGSIGDIPVVPRRTDAERRWHRITDRGDPRPSVFNVFCLWSFRTLAAGDQAFSAFVCAKNGAARDMERGTLAYNMCMMTGRGHMTFPGQAGLTFAHEAGHYLEGRAFHYENAKEGFLPLMRDDGMGMERLLRRDADRMNRAGR